MSYINNENGTQQKRTPFVLNNAFDKLKLVLKCFFQKNKIDNRHCVGFLLNVTLSKVYES